MCYFIVIQVHKSIELETVKSILLENGKAVIPDPNVMEFGKSIPGFESYFSTSGHCDCDTCLGSNYQEEDSLEYKPPYKDGEVNWSHPSVKKLLRKKWSRNKIKRSLEMASKAQENRFERMGSREDTELKQWVTIINSFYHKFGKRKFAILKHWDGDAQIDNEGIIPTYPVMKYRFGDDLRDFLLNIPQDNIVLF